MLEIEQLPPKEQRKQLWSRKLKKKLKMRKESNKWKHYRLVCKKESKVTVVMRKVLVLSQRKPGLKGEILVNLTI